MKEICPLPKPIFAIIRSRDLDVSIRVNADANCDRPSATIGQWGGGLRDRTRRQMKRIGMESGKSFDFDKVDPAIKKGLERAPKGAQELMKWKVATLARISSRRDRMIVARYVVPGMRQRKDRVPTGRAAFLPNSKHCVPGYYHSVPPGRTVLFFSRHFGTDCCYADPTRRKSESLLGPASHALA
jgi:hypothetical protein